MHALRRLAFGHRRIAALVVALALAMKLLMPGGFMPTLENGSFTVIVCSGTGGPSTTMTIPAPARHDGGGDHAPAKAEPPCAFAGLSTLGLAAADPILLAAAILFVMALGLRAAPPPAVAAAPRLRPPLRGPPATA